MLKRSELAGLNITELDIKELSQPENAKEWLSAAAQNGYTIRPYETLASEELQSLAIDILHLVLGDLRQSAHLKEMNLLN